MKTRIVYPRLWNDVKFAEANVTTKLLFTYLISNEHLGLSRYTRISDRQIQFDTGLNSSQLEAAKAELEKIKWCFFYDEWIYHNHDAAYVDYQRNERVEIAKQKELDLVPNEVKTVFEQCLNSVQIKKIDNSNKVVQTTFKQGLNLNNKLKTINNNKEIINNKSKEKNNNTEMSLDDKAKWVIETYNEIFGKRLKVFKSIKQNLAYWLDAGYSANDIKKALEIAKYDDYWHDKITPVILLRQKNTRGEDVDYIGQFIAKDKQYRPTAQRKKTGILEILARKEAEKQKGGQDE